MDWLEILESVGPQYHDVDTLKSELAIAYVLQKHGVSVEQNGPKLLARCPFHEDENPSFDVWGENLERWGCYPCGRGGDVLDLVQEFEPQERFVLVKDRAAELLHEQKRSGWAGPQRGEKRKYDHEAGWKLVLASEGGTDGPWVELHSTLGRNVRSADPDVLRHDFRLGSYGNETIIPYYNRDGDLIAYKRRRPGGKAMAAPGADFSDVLYAEWLDDGRGPVLLCEGESDVWAATAAMPTWNVLGVPTGVGAHPIQAVRLKDRDVTLAFDGDQAGRGGLLRWYTALENVARSVRIVVMPDGQDLATVDDIAALVGSSVSVPPIPRRISAKAEGLFRNPRSEKAEPEPLSNFSLVPKRQLAGDGVDAWECIIQPSGDSVVITTHDLSGKRQMVDWAARYGGAWYGSDTDAQHLQAWLQSIRPFLAAGYTTQVAGLHSQHFVYPGGRIGPDYWVYAAGKQDVELHRYVHLEDGAEVAFTTYVKMLRALHSPSVSDPILAWLSIAPLRSLVSPFPALAVLGSSGSGKTTLIETLTRGFCGTDIGINLASTTRFAIQAMVSATNCFPVWFDEYRPGAAADAITALDQIIRDAYNGHGSIKGGMGEHWSQVRMLKAEAPMIVSGEDAFTETSHLERLVTVYLPREGRSPRALEATQALGHTSFPFMRLSYLREALVAGELDLTVSPVELEGLAPRMQYNLGVLHLGWRVLQDMCERVDGGHISDPDFSHVVSTWMTDNKGNPILDALRWALAEPDAMTFMVEKEGVLHVKPRNFVNFVRKAGFVLPGHEKAVRRILMEDLAGQDDRTYIGGKQVRTISIPIDVLH